MRTVVFLSVVIMTYSRGEEKERERKRLEEEFSPLSLPRSFNENETEPSIRRCERAAKAGWRYDSECHCLNYHLLSLSLSVEQALSLSLSLTHT